MPAESENQMNRKTYAALKPLASLPCGNCGHDEAHTAKSTSDQIEPRAMGASRQENKTMYGFAQKYTAETKRDEMQSRQPEYRFEVMPHSWNTQGVPLTWGVGCYMPYYCPAMPERFAGFVWFNPSR